MLLNEETVG